jgi:hypothetical protein
MTANDRLLLADPPTGRISTICNQRVRSHISPSTIAILFKGHWYTIFIIIILSVKPFSVGTGQETLSYWWWWFYKSLYYKHLFCYETYDSLCTFCVLKAEKLHFGVLIQKVYASSGNNGCYQERFTGEKVILELKISYNYVYTCRPISFFANVLTGIQMSRLSISVVRGSVRKGGCHSVSQPYAGWIFG